MKKNIMLIFILTILIFQLMACKKEKINYNCEYTPIDTNSYESSLELKKGELYVSDKILTGSETDFENVFIKSEEQKSLSDDLIIHYTFESLINNTIKDESGNSKNAKFEGGISLNNGILKNEEGCIILPSDSFKNVKDFSISLWVNAITKPDVKWQRLIDIAQDTNTYFSIVVNAGWPDASGLTVAVAHNDKKIDYRFSSTTPMPVNKWTRVTYTQKDKKGILYIGGTVVAEYDNASITLSDIKASKTFYIARTVFRSSLKNPGDPILNGEYDDFRVYSRALSKDEVNSLNSLYPSGITRNVPQVAQDFIDNSVIIRKDSPFALVKGKIVYFNKDNPSYKLKENNGNLMVPFDFAKTSFDTTMNYRDKNASILVVTSLRSFYDNVTLFINKKDAVRGRNKKIAVECMPEKENDVLLLPLLPLVNEIIGMNVYTTKDSLYIITQQNIETLKSNPNIIEFINTKFK